MLKEMKACIYGRDRFFQVFGQEATIWWCSETQHLLCQIFGMVNVFWFMDELELWNWDTGEWCYPKTDIPF
jgi:hypothetical protein